VPARRLHPLLPVRGHVVALASTDEAFEGYWRRLEADARALRGGWYFAGDTGYFDADGELFVTGRVGDMIITGGENVSPVEIERCLSLHPAVGEVGVVGLPDERLGMVIPRSSSDRGGLMRPNWMSSAGLLGWQITSVLAGLYLSTSC
jgi:acyl-coenzyme A synthetase/AMP-(fatty) acid ligase